MIIPREAGRITYSTKVKGLENRPNLDDLQKEVIIGSILGDGHLERNKSCVNYRLRISQSVKQKDYLFWKYYILKDLVLSKPRLHEPTNSLLFATTSHPEISALARLFYRDKVKILPKNISDYIANLRILSVWFMDDGNAIIRNGQIYGYHLNTQSFTQQENEILSYILRSLWGIESLLELNHGRYRLRIMKKISRENFRRIIEKYVVESMKYKLG